MKQEIICLSCYFAALFKEIAPFWALGILLGSLISVFAKERIHGLLGAMQGARFGAFGVIPASILGIVSPLCMYGTIPIAASLSEKGLKDDWLAAFMMSSILLNPQLMIYSAALGKGALAVRTLSAFLCGAAAAFMITGPATKVTNLGALKIVLGMRNFLLYLLFIMAFAAVTGLVTDFLV